MKCAAASIPVRERGLPGRSQQSATGQITCYEKRTFLLAIDRGWREPATGTVDGGDVASFRLPVRAFGCINEAVRRIREFPNVLINHLHGPVFAVKHKHRAIEFSLEGHENLIGDHPIDRLRLYLGVRIRVVGNGPH